VLFTTGRCYFLVGDELVDRGIQQARRGELSDGPDLAAAFAFADGIPDEE
jgi:hypothetical protein